MKKEYPNFKHIELNSHGHFIGSLYNAICQCKTKYFLLVQHDIEMVGDFPINKILNYSFDWNIIAKLKKEKEEIEETESES